MIYAHVSGDSNVEAPIKSLDALLASCYRNGRLPKLPRKQKKLYFDADRFRWLFTKGYQIPGLIDALQLNTTRGWSLSVWRQWIDEVIRKNGDDYEDA